MKLTEPAASAEALPEPAATAEALTEPAAAVEALPESAAAVEALPVPAAVVEELPEPADVVEVLPDPAAAADNELLNIMEMGEAEADTVPNSPYSLPSRLSTLLKLEFASRTPQKKGYADIIY